MWNSSRVPKTGQMIEKPSFYQIVVKKCMALRCIGKRTIVSLKVPFHKANERRRRLPESKNRSTVKAQFRRPTPLRSIQNQCFFPLRSDLLLIANCKGIITFARNDDFGKS